MYDYMEVRNPSIFVLLLYYKRLNTRLYIVGTDSSNVHDVRICKLKRRHAREMVAFSEAREV